jgi:PAS domain S-box-containing protein
MQFFNWVKSRSQAIWVYLLMILVLASSITVFFLISSIYEAESAKVKSELIESKVSALSQTSSATDLAVREYLIDQNPVNLAEYQKSFNETKRNYDSLRIELERQNYDAAHLQNLITNVGGAVTAHQKYLSVLQQGDSAQTVNGYKSLPGLYAKTITLSNASMAGEVKSNDAGLLVGSAFVAQILLILLVIPVLLVLSRKLGSQQKYLVGLNKEIEESNRKFVFDPRDEVDYADGAEIKSRLLTNLRKASHFIQQIASGNYDIQWEGMNETNREANKENIAGELIRMREQMKQVKEQDRIRIWSTEGLSKFGEIIRKHQDNFEALSDLLISSVVKYVDAKVGGLFILEQDGEGESEEKYLSLKACYAYDRKKFLVKKIALGEGLIGQAYLEGQTIYLKKVPQQYMTVTSGLGETNPSCLLVVPLKANDKIEGVLELASLKPFEKYEIEFLERLAETLASSVISIRSAEKTKLLLQTSQEQSEEMRAQEEEMRQNMEELEATQEQMHRQVSELNTLKESLEKEKYLFGSLMDNIPDSIYFKDQKSRLIRVSKHMVTHFGVPMEQILGKTDFDFQDEVHAREAFEDEKNIMKTRVPKIDYVEKEIKMDGSESYVSTTKMPLINNVGEVVGTFGISRNVTKLKKLEMDVIKKDELLKAEEKAYEERIQNLENEIKAKEEQLAKFAKQ